MLEAPEEEEPGEEELVPETPHLVPIRNCLALVGPELQPDSSYPVGQFEVPGDGTSDPIRIAVVAVAEVDGRVVITIPFTAWHRTVARRVLPATALQKPLPLTVEVVDRSTTGAPDEIEDPHFETAKVWFGLLSPAFEDSIIYDSESVDITPDFQFAADPALSPSVEGLTQAFHQHYAFVSAASQASAQEARASKSADSKQFDHRLQVVEASLQSIAESLDALHRGRGSGAVAAPLPPRPCPTTSTPMPTPAAEPVTAPKSPLTQTLKSADSDLVQSARMAGVPEEQIQEMLRLAVRGRARLGDIPASRKKTPKPTGVNVLSESEEEEDLPATAGAGSHGGDPMVTALSKLTEIASHLTLEKRKGRTLEALLDGAGLGGSSESGSTSSTRKYSAALRALRNALSKQPEELSKVIEKNMKEDFYKVAQMPGTSTVPVSARAWLELRSRVQGYQTPVRFLWSVAGVLDALVNDRVAEARARCGLILAMRDQMAIDRGNWVVASEIALEDPPPMAAFNTHTLPSEAEPPHTKLIDSRWLELIMAKLADVDNLNEKKKKLGGRKPLPTSDVEAAAAKAAAKKGQKGKGDKGGGKGGDRAAAPDPQS